MKLKYSCSVNQVNYGTKSLRSFGNKIWNFIPHHVKSAQNLETFKKIINNLMPCLVTVLLVVWNTFHKNLLDIYYRSAFLFIVIFTLYTYSPLGLSQF